MADAEIRLRFQARDELGQYTRMTDRAARAVARRLAEEAQKEARRILAPHRKTGGMSEAIQVEDNGKVCYVVNTHPGGHSMEKGQVPHEIEEGFGQEKTIHHPGAQPVPHIKPGSEAAYRQRDKIVREEVRRAGL